MIARKRICKGLDISVEDLFIDIDRLARAFYPAILACWNSEEGQREFAAWQAEQAHHTANKEKQSVPDCWVFVKQFSRNDMATACQDWLRVPS